MHLYICMWPLVSFLSICRPNPSIERGIFAIKVDLLPVSKIMENLTNFHLPLMWLPERHYSVMESKQTANGDRARYEWDVTTRNSQLHNELLALNYFVDHTMTLSWNCILKSINWCNRSQTSREIDNSCFFAYVYMYMFASLVMNYVHNKSVN